MADNNRTAPRRAFFAPCAPRSQGRVYDRANPRASVVPAVSDRARHGSHDLRRFGLLRDFRGVQMKRRTLSDLCELYNEVTNPWKLRTENQHKRCSAIARAIRKRLRAGAYVAGVHYIEGPSGRYYRPRPLIQDLF